jgi:acyl-CoA thioesterase FadM
MNLYFRLLYVLIASFFKSKTKDIFQTYHLSFRVLPNDMDVNGHMNNGRYATLMDLGRIDMVLRNGLMKVMHKNKCVPVLASLQMRFRLPLFLWQRYDLQTKVICWDEKWVFMEQRFIITTGKKKGAVAAIGLLKGSFYDTKAKQTVPTQDLLEIIGVQDKSPAFPDHIQKWIRAEESLKDSLS